MFSEITTEAVIRTMVTEIRKQIELNKSDLGAVLALKRLGQFMLTQFEWTAPEWAGEFESVFSTDVLNVHTLEFFTKKRLMDAGASSGLATRTYHIIRNSTPDKPPETLGQFLEKYKGSEGRTELFRLNQFGRGCFIAIREALKQVEIPFN